MNGYPCRIVILDDHDAGDIRRALLEFMGSELDRDMATARKLQKNHAGKGPRDKWGRLKR